ncbi:FAD-dependent thymidylate synthase [Clostridium botulinum]|uniref:Flavin-dependent thymidylate synthase n=1 Tax=Clostridium botulinum CFSAN001627 TaxID=1232189 RepID=M1ZZ55_CLOBO|nr:FAD-dependent thymidylate synthase [Clostridium botulinum]EKN42928.1 FAD-dependent thymidylate synthase [Clostridium botulinum CFSAN001627]APC82167.1 thymidylate synthase, flavin-dependent [Clostridium botulinum]AXG97785.1 FAD-dependent thymidylate synthase [Clostridium botulinum]MBY6773570.1 FAD-dependent thymidylate synthase [Clostridium botulinum]MBY6850400.1 FAD-dependent thymidylate synthase [Clostridium botulinum]
MKVHLLSYTINPVETTYRAFKQCYAKGTARDIKIPSNEEMINFICKWMGKGHESPVEHVSFTFSIEGVSRALTHQLVRHRIASYSHQSQRYVNGNNFDFVVPRTWQENVNSEWIEQYKKETMRLYNELVGLGVPKEDARYILPNATTSNIVVTMNLRSLRHFYDERSCIRAQWEIRELANKMMVRAKEIISFADYKAKKCGITCFECES